MAFKQLKGYLDSLQDTMKVPAYELIITKDHERVFQYRRGSKPGGIYWFYSSTKLFTVTAALRLVERGVISLDDPVSMYIPAFAELTVNDGGQLRPARTQMKIRHLFTMSGGMNYDTGSREITSAADRSTVGIVSAMAKTPLLYDPGEGFEYSLCHDVLAAVVETAAAMPYGKYIEENIAGPLGMKDVTFHPDAKAMERMVPQCVIADGKAVNVPDDNIFRLSPEYESGGAGLCGTAEDYIRLPDALANRGRGADGYVLLRPETVELMAANQLNDVQLGIMHRNWHRNRSYGYAMGVRTRMDHSDGGKSPVGEFGWDGAAGCYSVIDPKNRLAMFYVQHVLGHGEAFEIIHPHLRDLMYEE